MQYWQPSQHLPCALIYCLKLSSSRLTNFISIAYGEAQMLTIRNHPRQHDLWFVFPKKMEV
jgi:hypothetical protein